MKRVRGALPWGELKRYQWESGSATPPSYREKFHQRKNQLYRYFVFNMQCSEKEIFILHERKGISFFRKKELNYFSITNVISNDELNNFIYCKKVKEFLSLLYMVIKLKYFP